MDYDLGTALGIGEFAGGILLTILIMFMATSLPLWKRSMRLAFIMAILVLCFGVAVAWLNIFVIIIIVFAIAVGVADKFTDLFGRVRS